MKREHLRWAVAVLVVWACWLAWWWQPGRQLRLHQEHLRKAFAGRNWNRVRALVASDYSDPWGGSREEMISGASEVLGSFFSLTIRAETRELSVEEGRVVEKLNVLGNGGPFASLVTERVNGLPSPFVFHWRHGARPWDWQLVSVEQPELHVEQPGF